MALTSLPELAGLVARAQKGDRAAFEKIVHGTARMIYAQIVLTVRDRQKAEDITQEVYVAAWKGIAAWKPGGGTGEGRGSGGGVGFIAWLQTVARNATLDAIKREQRLKRGGPAPAAKWKLRWDRESGPAAGEPEPPDGSGGSVKELADASPEPAAAAESREARARALAMLEELPEEYRRVLSMRYLAGSDYAAIREQLGLTDGALRGLLNRGMALLRERMGRSREMR